MRLVKLVLKAPLVVMDYEEIRVPLVSREQLDPMAQLDAMVK